MIAAPVTPNASINRSEVQTRAGTSFSSPVPNFFATNCVSARPSPKSIKPAYPIRAHARVSTPKRSLPSARIRIGIENTATIRGAPLPIRFQMVLRANSRPRVRCKLAFVEVSDISKCHSQSAHHTARTLSYSFQRRLFHIHRHGPLDQLNRNYQAASILPTYDNALRSLEWSATNPNLGARF